MRIKFAKWSKYNPRSDVKRGTWFRMQNDFFTNHQLFDFTNDEKLCFIYLITLRSSGDSDWVSLSFSHAEKIGGIKKSIVESTIKKLEKIQVLHVDVTDAVVDVTPEYATDRQTDKTNKQTNKQERDFKNFDKEQQEKSSVASFENRFQFDFGALYELYPRKQKRGLAMSLMANQIQDPETYQDLKTAIQNYRAFVERSQTAFRFQLTFAKFFDEWKDWLDPENGSSVFNEDEGVDAWLKERGQNEPL